MHGTPVDVVLFTGTCDVDEVQRLGGKKPTAYGEGSASIIVCTGCAAGVFNYLLTLYPHKVTSLGRSTFSSA